MLSETRRRKILRIVARLNIGGPARNAILLTEGIDNCRGGLSLPYNYYKTILVCGEVDRYEGDMSYLAQEKGIKPVVIKELGREISWKDDFVAFWKIFKIIYRERPDIIHTHTAKAGTLGRLAGILYNFIIILRCNLKVAATRGKDMVGAGFSLRKTVLVHTFHGHVLHSYFGRFKSWVFVWIERFLARFTDKIIVVSEALKKELVERYKIASQEKFCLVPLGLELDGLFNLEYPINYNQINIGIVGRLVPIKNHKMLFRVAEKLKVKSEKLKVKYTVIGDGETREELENYVRELGIEDIVEFKGWIKDLAKIYSGLDIVVLTSLNEGTPLSLIEAMAVGRPVVATKVGGVPDILEDGKSGYLVESSDIDGFSERLLNLISDPEKRRVFGEYGRRSVRDRFSKERLIRDMEGLYNNCLL